ncbi:helix-turn-helix domain-containing protein [Mycobacterium conspicuum]|uniref:Insertion element IS150 protein InsJ-like helix-turn-helix domain-containing protein n=1 Tax=Mycobacterium conspicuum TaxID=44010 RepID=A0A7I7YHJ9_9MYCO|nr:hypothetical protein MCNS_43510 [Mycobacterium conspicuum]
MVTSSLSRIWLRDELSTTVAPHAAKTYGLSRQQLHRLLKRYHQGGLEAVDPRSRRPASNPRAVRDDVIIAIVRLREQLSADGLDGHAGPRWNPGSSDSSGVDRAR